MYCKYGNSLIYIPYVEGFNDKNYTFIAIIQNYKSYPLILLLFPYMCRFYSLKIRAKFIYIFYHSFIKLQFTTTIVHWKDCCHIYTILKINDTGQRELQLNLQDILLFIYRTKRTLWCNYEISLFHKVTVS